MTSVLAAAKPAGGAATQDIVLATGGALVLTVAVVVIGVLYRSGKVGPLQRLAAFSERQWGLPSWVSLSGELSSLSLLVALAGMYWDISLHIDEGRDPGPLANPSHYLILFGLFGLWASGFLAIIMGDSRGGSSMLKRARTWKIPVGGVMLFACASFALLGFPLDDGWHRLFGQDVTLWGPTHLMLFGGAGITLLGRATLLVEGMRAAGRRPGERGGTDGERVGLPGRRLIGLQRAGLIGGFLIGMSTFQGEFDFGVPQFQLLFQPLLIAFAAGIALVTARIWAGKGGALIAVAFFVGIRGLVSIFVGPVMGEITPHFPLYIAEGLLVEGVALFVSTRRPLRFGIVSGLLIGTIGFAAEWGWSHVWMRIPWTASLLPEGLVVAVAAGIIGGTLGALAGAALASDRVPFPRGIAPKAALVASFAGLFALTAFGLHTSTPNGVRTSVVLTPAPAAGAERYANARVTFTPRSAAEHAKWLTITAWQGHKRLVVDRLERSADGSYRTTKPIPIYGDWKTMVRLHRGNEILGTPIYLPADPAIPVKGVPAKAAFTRPLESDHKLLQREAKATSGIVPILAYLLVLSVSLALCALIVWGMARLARDGAAYDERRRDPGRSHAASEPPLGERRVLTNA